MMEDAVAHDAVKRFTLKLARTIKVQDLIAQLRGSGAARPKGRNGSAGSGTHRGMIQNTRSTDAHNARSRSGAHPLVEAWCRSKPSSALIALIAHQSQLFSP